MLRVARANLEEVTIIARHVMDLEDLRLSVEDLERYGPALIVDHKGKDGTRVLVWSR